MNWKNIWSNKTIEDDITEKSILEVNGYDTKYTDIDLNKLDEFIDHVKDILNIKYYDGIFEIGCGSGYFINKFKTAYNTIGGIDYSEKLIEIANILYDQASYGRTPLFKCQEANTYDIESDYILSYSVFFYFNSYEYATEVLNRMHLYSKKGFAIFDIPDLQKKEESELQREKTIFDYKNRYNDLSHLYFTKDFFILYGENNNLECIIEDQHEHSSSYKYRFNAYFKKK